MDLDRFKEVNDGSGHAAGDEVLRQVARLLVGSVRQRDTVARLGGDEFTAILDGCPLHEATRIASEIQRKVAGNRFRWGGRIYSVGISIGVVPVDSGGDPAAHLLAADGACYLSKAQGGLRVVVGGHAASGPIPVPP
jgi:diguanylate cyclase (GGDEF)-like protein